MSLAFNAVVEHAQAAQDELLKAFSDVIQSGTFLNGAENVKLETYLKDFHQVKHAKALGSGHDALALTLQALDLRPDDEVITQVNAYPTLFPLLMAGCQVKLVDIDDNSQMNLDQLEQVISPKTKAVVVAHLYGLCGDVSRLRKICRQAGVALIEDVAQAFGTLFQGQPLGTFGLAGCLSFYPSKNLGALGDGGALLTSSAKLYKKVLAATQYGEQKRYHSQFIAGHSRLPELQAASLNTFIPHLMKIKKQRQQVRMWYKDALRQSGLDTRFCLLESHPKSDPFYHLLILKVEKRLRLQRFLLERNIPTMVHYPVPVHQVAAFRGLPWYGASFPNVETMVKRRLSLPFHEYLTKNEVEYIVEAIKTFYAQH